MCCNMTETSQETLDEHSRSSEVTSIGPAGRRDLESGSVMHIPSRLTESSCAQPSMLSGTKWAEYLRGPSPSYMQLCPWLQFDVSSFSLFIVISVCFSSFSEKSESLCCYCFVTLPKNNSCPFKVILPPFVLLLRLSLLIITL